MKGEAIIWMETSNQNVDINKGCMYISFQWLVLPNQQSWKHRPNKSQNLVMSGFRKSKERCIELCFDA